MKYIASSVLVSTFLFLPVQSHAQEAVVRTGDAVSISADQTVKGDFYVYSGLSDTTMSGDIKEDMYAAAGSITMNGQIEKDLSLLTGSAQIHGVVKDDVRVVAGDVTIGGEVGGDVVVLAGSLKVLSSAKIAGDIIFYGGSAEISGDVQGSILGKSEKMRIDGKVGKDINIQTASALILGENAKIAGNIQYISDQTMVRAQNTEVAGTITQSKNAVAAKDFKQQIQTILIPYFILLFAALSLHLFFRKQILQMVQITHKVPLKAGLIGFAALILGPVVSLILFATVLGSLCGVILLAVSVLLSVFGFTLSGYIVGSYIALWTIHQPQVTPLWIAIGTAGICLLFFIPFIGPLVVLAFSIIAMGTVLLFAYAHS